MTDQVRNFQASDQRSEVDPRTPICLVIGAGSDERRDPVTHETLRDVYPTEFVFAVADPGEWRRMSAASGGMTEITTDIAVDEAGRILANVESDPVRALYQLQLRRLGLLESSLEFSGILVDLGGRFETGSFVSVVQSDERLDLTFRIAQIICLVELNECLETPTAAFRRKIAEADTIILNDREVDTEIALSMAKDRIASTNPFAAVYALSKFQPDNSMPWRNAPGDFNHGSLKEITRETGITRLTASGYSCAAYASNFFNEAFSNAPDSPPPNRALRLRLPGTVDLTRVMRTLGDLLAVYGTDLHRFRAVLNVRNAEHPVAIDVMGGTLLHPAYHASAPRRCSDIYIIAKGLDVHRTLRAFEVCNWQHAATEGELGAAI